MMDASTLTSWQSCRRQAILGSEWLPIQWRPKHLFAAVLRQALFNVSNGNDPAYAAQEAITTFLQEATNPGLDLVEGTNSYKVAKDWATMLSTVIRGAAKLTLLTMTIPKPVELSYDVSWQPLAWADDSGQLHRWIVTDSWGEDERYRELHGWHAFGDIVATGCPMMVHIVEIGQQRDGRRHSSWVRGFKQPGFSNTRMHFRNRNGGPLKGWTPVFLTDTKDDPDEWVNQMLSEGELTRVLKHITINVPSDRVVKEAIKQIVSESRNYQATLDTPWQELVMSRTACDGLVPCPYQSVCYDEKLVDIAGLNIYKRASTGTKEMAQLVGG